MRVFRLGVMVLVAGCAAPAPGARTEPGPAPAAVDRWEVPALPPAAPIAREEYATRRRALAAGMGDGVLLVLGAEAPQVDYQLFHQTPALRYLTGITEPGAALLIAKRGGQLQERLLVPRRNPAREVWEGARLGVEGAQARTGIASAPVSQFGAVLDSLARRGDTLYTTEQLRGALGPLATVPPAQQVVERLVQERGLTLASLNDQLQRLRGSKSAAELDRIRRAVYITNLAHRAAMRTIEPGMNEFELQALIEYVFRRNGAERPSFATIVGSGPNSTTLHYNADDRFMQAGEVVVMDIGASYDGYAADVTRTVPVTGRFSPEQRAIYEIVLAAQKAAERRVRPGATWDELRMVTDSVLAAGLARLGLIESPDATYDCREGRCPQLRLFFLHGLGHGIGLEVHDPEASYYGGFQVGSAFTIEPGLYIRADALDHLSDTPGNRALLQRLRPVVERYRDIGVRIEDDYIVTPTGTERISAGAPREIEEIEALAALPGVAAAERRGEVVEWYRAIQPR